MRLSKVVVLKRSSKGAMSSSFHRAAYSFIVFYQKNVNENLIFKVSVCSAAYC